MAEGPSKFNRLQAHIQASFEKTDDWILNDLRAVQTFIESQKAEGSIPYRLLYMVGGANVTGTRVNQNSDLGLLLRYLEEIKHVTQEAPKTTYILCFDSEYTAKTIVKDLMGINSFFKRQSIQEHPPQLQFLPDTRTENDLKKTTLLAQCKFGPQVTLFFFKKNLTSLCLQDKEDKREYIKTVGLHTVVEDCKENQGAAFRFLEALVSKTFVEQNLPGELYVYNCAWENLQVGGRFVNANAYLEGFPELLRILGKEDNGVKKFLLYNHFRDLFASETIVISGTSDDVADLKEVTITKTTDFRSVSRAPKGGTRRRTRSGKKSRKNRRWRKARTF